MDARCSRGCRITTLLDGSAKPGEKHTCRRACASRQRPREGAEIAWEAEADFESGIGGFVILRDGQELTKLSEKPPANSYGRRLFQEMSYHDTPEPPVAEMRYVDRTGKANEKESSVASLMNLRDRDAGLFYCLHTARHWSPDNLQLSTYFHGNIFTWSSRMQFCARWTWFWCSLQPLCGSRFF
jgi:hypothetical protein